MPDTQTFLLGLTIAVALAFDLTNGFHDTANSVATTVGTRALPPRIAIAFAAILNLVGAVVATQILNAKVANTIGDLVGREKKFIFCPTVASDGKLARAKKFCRGFAHSISGLLIHESPRETVWKIAEGFSSVGLWRRKAANRASFVPSWWPSGSQFETQFDFPNSFRRSLLGN